MTQAESQHGNGSQGIQVIPAAGPNTIWAAEIARAIFENNAPMIFEAYRKMLHKGNAQHLAERE